MKIIRSPHDEEHPFTRISNQIIESPQLSSKAKMVLCFLLSRPETWQVSPSGIARYLKEGVDYVRSGLKELEQAGYLQIDRTQKQTRFHRFDYTVMEFPIRNDRDGNSASETTRLLTNNITTNNISRWTKINQHLFLNGEKLSFSLSPTVEKALLTA